MGEQTGISWTDHTFNPWIGCTKIHSGCLNCYAEAFAYRYGKAEWGPTGTRVMTSPAYWRQPMKWDREAAAAGVRRRVFCGSLCDVFEDWPGSMSDVSRQSLFVRYYSEKRRVVTMDDVRADLFGLIDRTSLLWLVLTKRPENVRPKWLDFVKDCGVCDGVGSVEDGLCPQCGARPKQRDNVLLGTSISTQEHADRQIPELLGCRDLCAGTFLSIEPLLGPIDMERWLFVETEPFEPPLISWVIVGGESGPHARPMNPTWARSIRDQCRDAGVPFFFKQSSGRRPGTGVELDGEIVQEFPEVLQ